VVCAVEVGTSENYSRPEQVVTVQPRRGHCDPRAGRTGQDFDWKRLCARQWAGHLQLDCHGLTHASGEINRNRHVGDLCEGFGEQLLPAAGLAGRR
jgi:hypothetical protein